jgi:hypothetical protein
MARPQRPPADRFFIGRLKEIVDLVGSQAALAKKAGLAASTFQNYVEGGEPPRPVLVALAAAAGVSVNWLATGQGSKDRSLLPEGFVEIPSFDLRENIYPLLQGSDGVKGSVIMPNEVRERTGAALGSLTAARIADGLPPTVAEDDVIIFASPSPPRADVVVADHRLYLLAYGVKAIVRRLRQEIRHGQSILIMTDADGRDQIIEAHSPEFRILGRVHWRGGLV